MTKNATTTTPAAPKTSGTSTAITITSLAPDTTTNPELNTGVTASGASGAATAITVQAFLNDTSIGTGAADISGSKWTCDVQGEYSGGTLTVTATDDNNRSNTVTSQMTV